MSAPFLLKKLTLKQKRYVTIVFTFTASLGCGTSYVYSTYSTQFADRIGLNATQASILGIAGQAGLSLFGALGGLIIDRHQPMLPMFLGALLIFTGYRQMYLAYVNSTQNLPLLIVAYAAAGFGNTLVFNSSVRAAAMNFPRSRGTATSVPMSAFGLSAFFFSSVAGLVFPGDTAGFLEILMLLTSGLAFLSLPFVHVHRDMSNMYAGVAAAPPPQPAEGHGRGHIHGVNIDTASTDGYQNIDDEENMVELEDETEPSQSDSLLHTESSGSARPSVHLEQTHHIPARTEKHPHTDVGWRLLGRRDFWEYFVLLAFVSGTGQMYIYSVGYCVRALANTWHPEYSPGHVQSMQAFQVALISLTNFIGRLISGGLSDYMVNKLGLQRLWLLVVSLILGFFGHTLGIFIQDTGYLWLVSVSIGLSYGLVFGVYPSIVSESFGLKHFSQNWGLVAASPVFSAYLLNVMFGKIYDSNSIIEDGGAHVCLKGSGCYNIAFIVTAASCLAGIALSLFMIHVKKSQPRWDDHEHHEHH